MDLFIAFLSLVLVLDAVFLMLLILIQLPKKEAGAGLAFGAGATDALFGAGKGTVLTNATKYCAGAFLFLCLVLAILYNHRAKQPGRVLMRELENKAKAAAVGSNAAPASMQSAATNVPIAGIRPTAGTNLVAPVTPVSVTVSNAPAK